MKVNQASHIEKTTPTIQVSKTASESKIPCSTIRSSTTIAICEKRKTERKGKAHQINITVKLRIAQHQQLEKSQYHAVYTPC